MSEIDYSNPNYYFNRELSWLEFNERVLEEAQDKLNPVMERIKFLAITASNMDEFFMVRVSGLWDQVEAGYSKRDCSGLLPKEQLALISKKCHEMVYKQYNCFTRSILPQFEKEGILLQKYENLNPTQKKFVKDYFNSTLYPVLTPMAIDQSRPFPLLANKSLNVLVQLDDAVDELYAFVQVPTVVPRILALPDTIGRQFILLEEIIKAFADQLFQGHTVREANAFRITRNSDLTIDEEDGEDLLIEIERSIKRRKWGEPVRLELDKNMENDNISFLTTCLELDEEDVYEVNGPLDLTFLFSLTSMSGYEHLKDKPLPPQPSQAFYAQEDIFEVIKKRDVLVHHPYEDFECVVNFVRTAANDPQVLAIKQTLYRVSGNSPVIASLIQAAENGKQVTVIIELKARFDEENNILWAKKLEKAGCHVIYGLLGLKTHCKLCLVVRREDDGICRYVHLGTGNYNDSTAKIYTDLGLFTSKESFGSDISALFNVLTGYSQPPNWKKISVAPISLRQTFMTWIENEISHANEGREARIIAKLNSLVDTEIIQALYRASAAGVRIDLIIRGICCLRPGVAGVSDNIRVISIVDRYLEHSRIYYYENGGNPRIFLSSADWMPRNLNRRVEVAFPVEQDDAKERIISLLELTLEDTVKARELLPDGSYEKIDRRGKEYIHSQVLFYEMAVEEYKKAREKEEMEMFVPVLEIETEIDVEDE